MMTLEEQEERVYKEVLSVKSDLEKILDYKISKKNFKKAIVDITKKAAIETDLIVKLPADAQDRIQNFFIACRNFLGEVIWQEFTENNIKVLISYKDKPLTLWNIPIDMFFSKAETFNVSLSMFSKSMEECFLAYFLSPNMREAVMNGDVEVIKMLYNSFNRPSMESTLNNLTMLKENFPDFYNHITTKLDIMTVEDMKQFIQSKNGTRKRNKAQKRTPRRVSRVKKV
jgi:hypothetical protein